MTEFFDMNPQLNFPIPEKSIYQMGFNSAAGPAPVANYVTEPNTITNHLQILDLLNPQNAGGSDDKKTQFLSDFMGPHYEKQAEIEKKIDDLSEILNRFIRSQQSVNELIIERCLRQHSPATQLSTREIQIDDPALNENSETGGENEVDKRDNELTENQMSITNPLPVYPVPITHEPSTHSPIRNRSISPEKMETGGSGGEMSVRDFLKTTMTVQKADEKILEEERERERDEAAQAVRYNKFRVRNRPKKYKRSAVTFTSSLEATVAATVPMEIPPPSSSTQSTVGNPGETSQLMEQLEQSQNNSGEIEDNIFQPIVVPCAQHLQRVPELDLALMPNVFPTSSSYVLNSSALDSTSHQNQGGITSLAEPKFQTDPNNLWKAVDGVTQLLVDAPSLLESDLRSFADHSHHSSFLPFVGNHEPLHRSAFVPAQYNKDRRFQHQMDPNLTDTLRNL